MSRLALGQVNLTVGDLTGNVDRMAAMADDATKAGADLIAFPELAITGYPPEDLVLRPEFVREGLEALDALARRTATTCPVVVGFVDRSEVGLHNAAALLRDGTVETRYHKVQLPNFGVFDERRYFVPGTQAVRIEAGGLTCGLSVCEDAWHAGVPFARYAGVPLIVNINGSPYHRGKREERADILRDRARETGAWIAYINAVGGQDELVFDGGSMLVGPDGSVRQRASMFSEDLLIVDLHGGTSFAEPREAWPVDDADEVWRALVLGLGDYVRKNGFREAVLGLSGGIDSALTATLAVDALGADSVRGLAMPSPFSSTESLDDAVDCAKRLGIRLDTIGITGTFDAYRYALAEVFAGHPDDVTEENLQARIRGTLLMALSNKFGSIVLATGNKSEYAVGYSTLYGDMAGGFAPIKDVPKTLVYELADRRNATAAERGETPPIPERTITKPPSAELRLDQKDTDSLPPYDELDPVIEAYVESDLGVDDMVSTGFDRGLAERVVSMIDRTEYKRRQAAPGVKITPKAFGRDRRMPITNRYAG
ncbi:MAG: NAD+ synthase [Actinomycetota bacterium]|nr:NAD+ synthase [Actinomycetota bacterium]MDH5224283.1 NAD+ synthase [Actinomycetota bacterium]MDH5314060.1 NAD+ synthase [Actinomycetota bacterium]